MDVVMASIYAVCAFAVGFAFGVVAMKLAYQQKAKEKLMKESKEKALKEAESAKEVDLSVSVLSSGDAIKTKEVEN